MSLSGIASVPKVDETNPFERIVLDSSTVRNEATYVGIWRTVLVRFDKKKENR